MDIVKRAFGFVGRAILAWVRLVGRIILLFWHFGG